MTARYRRSALIFYEHLMTLSQEVRLVWGHKLTGATVIFFLNRYLLLAFGVATLLQVFAWDTALVS